MHGKVPRLLIIIVVISNSGMVFLFLPNRIQPINSVKFQCDGKVPLLFIIVKLHFALS